VSSILVTFKIKEDLSLIFSYHLYINFNANLECNNFNLVWLFLLPYAVERQTPLLLFAYTKNADVSKIIIAFF